MKKTVSQKGITLVALIVTIVILLILAVAAINAISVDGIIIKANDVVSQHNQKVTEEKEQISWLERLLGKKPGNQGGSTDSGEEGGSTGSGSQGGSGDSGNTIEPDEIECEHVNGWTLWDWEKINEYRHQEIYVCVGCQSYTEGGTEYHSYNNGGHCKCGDTGTPNTTTRPNPS